MAQTAWHHGTTATTATTATTHLFKTQIGQLPNGIVLSNSVENEYYCLKLLEAFGLPVNGAEIQTFGETKVLVIERFDRRWAKDGKLLRLPQDDCCQALSVPPTVKYQSDSGPGVVQILDLLKGSDTPAQDQTVFIKAQLLFWLIGATDGHAKNFSVFLAPGGFHMTPLYDVLTAQPSFHARQIRRNQMKLAMAVGNNNHYRFQCIHARHFMQIIEKANLPKSLMRDANIEAALPESFPEEIHAPVKEAMTARIRSLELAEAK